MLQAAPGQQPLPGRPPMGFPGGQPFPGVPPFPGGQHFPGGPSLLGRPPFQGGPPFPGRPRFPGGTPAFPGGQPFPVAPFAPPPGPFNNAVFTAPPTRPALPPGVVMCFKCGGIGHKADVCPSIVKRGPRAAPGPRPAGASAAPYSGHHRQPRQAEPAMAAAAVPSAPEEPALDPFEYLKYETVFQDEETQEVVVTLREVEILTVRPNGDLVLNSGGVKDDLTLAAINASLGVYGLRVSQSTGPDGSPSWRVTDGKAILRRFEDGMVLPQVPSGGMARIERLLKVKQAEDPGRAAVEAAEEIAVATAKAPETVPAGRGAGRGARGRGTSVWSRGGAAVGAARYTPY
eukprot:jgi/Mesvir1/7114/Mv09218-RA.1